MEILEQQIRGLVSDEWLANLITAVVVLAITALVARVVTRFLRHILDSDNNGLPASSIFVNIARAAIWFLGVCVLLSTCFGVDVSAAITALGVGGIALSLGFQDTISNLIGGLQVSLLRIVTPGDNIEVGTSKGVVEDVTWRHTTIRNAKGERVVIPNSVINKTALKHLPPTNQLSVPVVVEGDGTDLSERAHSIEQAAAAAARAVGSLATEPVLTFSEIRDLGFAGALVFSMEDAAHAAPAADAVLRAIAPLTRA